MMKFAITQRMECTKKTRFFSVAGAVIIAFFAVAVLLICLGFNPVDVFIKMLEGSVGSAYSFKSSLIRTIPLALTSIGILYAFRIQFWNIGGEGQILMGAFAATSVALFVPGLPRPLTLLLMITAGFIGGAVWAVIPGIMKIRRGINETIITLMFNYIALQWVTYLQYSAWKDKKAMGFPKIKTFGENAILPDFLGIHSGFYILIIIAALTFILFKYTKLGFQMHVIGESEETAKYIGLKKNPIIILMVLLSGGICGLTGVIQASAVNNTLSVSVTNGVGFTAIIIAWLSNLNPLICLFASFIFALLMEGASYIQTVFQIPESIANLMQGIILFSIIGSNFFINYKVKLKTANPPKT